MDVACPVSLWNMPAAQLVQASAPVVDWKAPFAQLVQAMAPGAGE